MEIIQYTQFVNKQETEGVTFVQFSDKLLTPNSKTRDYYRRAYSKMEGYYFPEHYMEIPFWIPTIAGMLPDSRYRKSLHIVEDMERSASIFDVIDNSEKLLFSVMDANVRQVREIVERTKKQAIMGGYTDPSEFSGYDNARYLKGLEDLAEVFDVNIGVPPDYSLFRREKCIPRVTLSTGCVVNVNFLAAHYGNERGQFPYDATSVGDRDQNTPEKSWLTSDEVKRMMDAVDAIYHLTAEN